MGKSFTKLRLDMGLRQKSEFPLKECQVRTWNVSELGKKP